MSTTGKEAPPMGYLPLQTKETQPYSPDEQERLLAATQTPFERAFLLLGLDAGLRVAEMAALQREDVHLTTKRIEIRHNLSNNKPATPKSKSSERTVYLTARLAEALTEQLRSHSATLVLPQPNSKQGTGALRCLLGRLNRRAGLPAPYLGAPHRLRHSFATRLARAGATAKEIASLLGHSGLKEAERYIHLYTQDLPRAISLLEAMEQKEASQKITPES